MKKIVCIIISLLCLCAYAIPCFAVTDVIFTVTAEQQPKKNVVVNVNVSKDSSLYTTELYITFNPDELEFVKNSASAGDLTQPLNPYITASEIAEGRVKISYTSTNPIDSSGVLCELEFRAVKDAVTSLDIEIEHAETFDGENIRSLTSHGDGTVIEITKQAVLPAAAIAVIAIIAVAVITTAVIIKKKKK